MNARKIVAAEDLVILAQVWKTALQTFNSALAGSKLVKASQPRSSLVIPKRKIYYVQTLAGFSDRRSAYPTSIRP